MHGGYANFYSRPCGRGDEADVCGRNAVIISTHAPAGGATYKVSTRVLTVRCISTHAPAGGATWMIRSYKGGGLIFLLTPLREGRLYRWYRKNGCGEISTHAPAGGATWDGQRFLVLGTISTHAPAGGATTVLWSIRAKAGISTHAPAGGATRRLRLNRRLSRFLLTPLREGRRSRNWHTSVYHQHFYSRPCGRGDVGGRLQIRNWEISTHAPAGGATGYGVDQINRTIFLLTPLREGRPMETVRIKRAIGFLLTPLREGRLKSRMLSLPSASNFYSRPCGRGDTRPTHTAPSKLYFYSRPCGRGDRTGRKRCSGAGNFYSRPCGRGDRSPSLPSTTKRKFLLTPLREGRRGARRCSSTRWTNFYSRPCGRGDLSAELYFTPKKRFLLTPLREGRPRSTCSTLTLILFLLTPLREGRQQFSTSPS